MLRWYAPCSLRIEFTSNIGSGTSLSWLRSPSSPRASPVQYDPRSFSQFLVFILIATQILFGSGDVLAQQAVDRRGLEKHDFGRTGRMALYGGGRRYTSSL
jgi:hypothetical protein